MFEMLSAADPPLLYAVAGVVVLAIASLFGLVLFASREETFEDVVEKQRKAQEALLHSLQQGTGKSGKQNKKWNKLKSKKTSKPKAAEEHDQDSGVDDDEISTETVTINTPPPTIAVEEPAPAPAATKKKKKNKKNKQPEVVEEVRTDEVVAEEEVVVEEEIVVEAEPEVETVPDIPSEDEVHESEDEEPDEVAIDEPVVEEEEVVVEEVLEVAEEPEPEPEPEAEPEPEPEVIPEPEPEPVKVEPVVEKSKSSKKKKAAKQKGPAPTTTNSIDKVMKDIQEFHMQAEEVQQLMDVLLEKQSELEQWQKPHQKADPMDQMKKRIAELETQFAEERQSCQAISGKLSNAKLELQKEINQRQSFQNEAQNRINQTAQEAETMRKRLEEKHVSDMHSAQSQISRMQQIIDDGATNHMELQRMKEENAHMKNASMMAQQLAEDKQSLMGELSQLQQTNRALRQEFDNLIVQHQQEMQNIQMAKVESEGALSQRLQEMNDQLLKVEAHNRNLQLEIAEQQRLAEQARLTETETFQMAAKPDDSEQIAKLKAAEDQLAELTQKCLDYEARLTASAPEAAAVPEIEVEPEVEVVSSASELQELAAKVAEKDELILQLEAKVSELTANQSSSSGKQSPDLVHVTKADLLGSEPLLTSESFEEVNPDKDYEGEVVEDVVVPTVSSEQESGPVVEQPEPEVVVVEVSTEESTPPEPMEDPTGPLKAEIEKLKVEAETAVAQKQLEIDQLQAKILAAESSTPVAEPVAPAADVDQLMAQIAQLQESLNAKDAEIAAAKETTTTETATDDDGPTKDELKEQLKTVKDELQGRTETTDELKLKNNELREKNWKVIDALATAEKQVEDLKKSTNIQIIKGLKDIAPDFSIPKFEDDYELLFKEFKEKVKLGSTESTEPTEMAEQVKSLTEEITELKKTNEIMNASQDEILKSQQENVQLKEENAHIKNVLIETESMLCRLQTGVDAEVQKWQAKVAEKDAELDTSRKTTDELKQVLSKHGYDHNDLATLESSLSDGQKQLMAEKEENTKIKTDLSEMEKSLTEAQTALQLKTKELEEASAKTSNTEEVTELNGKLKKTISERDLLIREYKNVKDSNTKMESELKETKQNLETKDKEIEQMKVELTTAKAASTTEPVVNGEKDAVIQNEM